MYDVVVTGIPRSGTTLACALIDSLDDAVCLSEPPWQDAWPRETSDRRSYVRRLCEDFTRVRGMLLAGESVVDRRRADGSAVTDYHVGKSGRTRKDEASVQPFARPNLSANFLLGMKHNAHYTCALDELVECDRFRIVAIVRHPLAVIGSWRALELPISGGRLPAGEHLWPELAAIATSGADVLLRQVRIYDLFCARYLRLSNRIDVLRYEDFAFDPSRLRRVFGRRAVREIPLRAVGRVPEDADDIRACLRKHAPHARELYPDV